MAATVRDYFSFLSPFAALADARIDALLAPTGARLEPRPVVPPPSDPPQGIAAPQIQEFKVSYVIEGAARWARRLGVTIQLPDPPFIDVSEASAAWFYANESGRACEYCRAVFTARFDCQAPGGVGGQVIGVGREEATS